MGAPLLTNERAEHKFLVKDDAFLPVVYCRDSNAKLLASICYGVRPLKVCGKDGKYKDKAVSTVRDNDVGQDSVGSGAGRAEEAHGPDC